VNDSLLWLLAGALILLGLAGIVLPALPGTLFVFGGIVLGAWIDDFTRVGWLALSAIGLLALLAWAMDYVAALLGAKRAGASRLALIGAALGTVAGIFMGLVGCCSCRWSGPRPASTWHGGSTARPCGWASPPGSACSPACWPSSCWPS
jgi:hypothetical protein